MVAIQQGPELALALALALLALALALVMALALVVLALQLTPTPWPTLARRLRANHHLLPPMRRLRRPQPSRCGPTCACLRARRSAPTSLAL